MITEDAECLIQISLTHNPWCERANDKRLNWDRGSLLSLNDHFPSVLLVFQRNKDIIFSCSSNRPICNKVIQLVKAGANEARVMDFIPI